MRNIFLALLIFGLASCGNIGVSENEKLGVDAALSRYGGVCVRHKGEEHNNGKTYTYFELEIKQSKELEKYAKVPELPASNIARLFYAQLGKEEDKYTHVKVNIVFNSGQSYKQAFPVSQLKDARRFVADFETVVNAMQQNNCASLVPLFDTGAQVTTESMEAYCAQHDTAYGPLSTAQPEGFSIYNSSELQKPVVHVAGVVQRAKGPYPFSIYFDRRSGKILSMKDKL